MSYFLFLLGFAWLGIISGHYGFSFFGDGNYIGYMLINWPPVILFGLSRWLHNPK